VAGALGAGAAYGDVRVTNVCFYGGEFPVHGRKANKDDEEPRHVEGCDRRWKHQAEIAGGGRAATFGGNMMKRYTNVKVAIESLLRYSEGL
jgi:hypothetical protein